MYSDLHFQEDQVVQVDQRDQLYLSHLLDQSSQWSRVDPADLAVQLSPRIQWRQWNQGRQIDLHSTRITAGCWLLPVTTDSSVTNQQ